MPFLLSTDVVAVFGGPATVPKVANRSLMADKYAEFPSSTDDKTARSRTIVRLTGGGFDEGPAVGARIQALSAKSRVSFRFRLGARMIVNHAGGVIENAGLALDRNSGAPFIPGSTIKGIARAGAGISGAKPEEVALVFGWAPNRNQETDIPLTLPVNAFGGSVAFLPAYPTGIARLERDIVTVHHPEYYAGKRPVALDDESPILNEFPVVAAGAEFQFILAPVGAARIAVMGDLLKLAGCNVLAKAKEWLIAGLTQHGVGSKTAAGYGWFLAPDAGKSAKAQTSGMTEREYLSLLKLADSPGQRSNLKREIEVKLQKPENAAWLKKFREATAGKDFKELRKQEWYPREG
jgi:CRISPR type III-B/RAMP module RAMP protein Cmr6